MLHLHGGQLPFFLLDAFQIAVHGSDPKVHGLRLVIFNQINFVIAEIFSGEAAVSIIVLVDCVHIRNNGVL